MENMDVFFQMANELPGVKNEVVSIILFSWNVLVACVKKDMSPHLCFVNVHVRVFFIPCKTFGKNGNLE